MPRNARVVIPGSAHHITQRGNNRQIVFEEDVDYLNYCRWINKYAGQNSLDILAYCLMPNHVHFIVIPKDKESLSRTFQMTHMRYAQYMNGKKKASGHLWQGRFYSGVMNKQHLYRGIRYVERNPVRSGFVRKAWRYPKSSARWHVGSAKNPDIYLKKTDLVDKNEWKEYLGEEDEGFKITGDKPLS